MTKFELIFFNRGQVRPDSCNYKVEYRQGLLRKVFCIYRDRPSRGFLTKNAAILIPDRRLSLWPLWPLSTFSSTPMPYTDDYYFLIGTDFGPAKVGSEPGEPLYPLLWDGYYGDNVGNPLSNGDSVITLPPMLLQFPCPSPSSF
jgi:hypothetical protein